MFYDILNQKRKDILPLLKNLKEDFYLAGGTALALQIGHRDSIDFDYFSEKDFDTKEFFERLQKIFKDFSVQKIQDEKNTLTIIVDKDIKLSFFSYKYPLLKEIIEEEYIRLASIEDIACMKLSAIVSRSTLKDYIDLYYVLKEYDLSDLLQKMQFKFPTIDTNLVIKSLVYFEDIIEEPIQFKNQNHVSLDEIKKFFTEIIKKTT